MYTLANAHRVVDLGTGRLMSSFIPFDAYAPTYSSTKDETGNNTIPDLVPCQLSELFDFLGAHMVATI